MKIVSLAVGGVLGTLLRYWLSGAVQESAGTVFPFGTFAVNILGCLVIGIFASLGQEYFSISPDLRLSLTVGFCGAFTTFSTLILESDHLLKQGQFGAVAANVILSVLFGFAAFFAGGWIGSKI